MRRPPGRRVAHADAPGGPGSVPTAVGFHGASRPAVSGAASRAGRARRAGPRCRPAGCGTGSGRPPARAPTPARHGDRSLASPGGCTCGTSRVCTYPTRYPPGHGAGVAAGCPAPGSPAWAAAGTPGASRRPIPERRRDRIPQMAEHQSRVAGAVTGHRCRWGRRPWRRRHGAAGCVGAGPCAASPVLADRQHPTSASRPSWSSARWAPTWASAVLADWQGCGRVGALAVDAMDRQPPQVERWPARADVGEQPVPQAAVDDVRGVEHAAVADGHGGDLLRVGVATSLGKRGFDGPAVPGEGTGALHLHDELLDTEARQHDVGPPDLQVHVAPGPVEHRGEEVFQDVLGDLLRRRPEQALAEALGATVEERRPRPRDPQLAPAIGAEQAMVFAVSRFRSRYVVTCSKYCTAGSRSHRHAGRRATGADAGRGASPRAAPPGRVVAVAGRLGRLVVPMAPAGARSEVLRSPGGPSLRITVSG